MPIGQRGFSKGDPNINRKGRINGAKNKLRYDVAEILEGMQEADGIERNPFKKLADLMMFSEKEEIQERSATTLSKYLASTYKAIEVKGDIGTYYNLNMHGLEKAEEKQ